MLAERKKAKLLPSPPPSAAPAGPNDPSSAMDSGTGDAAGGGGGADDAEVGSRLLALLLGAAGAPAAAASGASPHPRRVERLAGALRDAAQAERLGAAVRPILRGEFGILSSSSEEEGEGEGEGEGGEPGGGGLEQEGEECAPAPILARGRAASRGMHELGHQFALDALRVATADDLRVVPNATMRALTGSVSDGAESAQLFSGSDESGKSRDHLRRSMADWLHERLYNPSACVKHKVLTTLALLVERGPETFLPKVRQSPELLAEVERLTAFAAPDDPV